MRGAALTALVAALAMLVACKDDKRIRRARDAGAPVQAVEPAGGGEVLSTPEREPNESDAQASPLALPGGAQGTLDGETDVDVFKIDVPAAADGASMVRLELTALEGIDTVLELHDTAGTLVARSDRGPAKTVEGFPNAGLPKGTYFVVVRELVKPKKAAKKPKKGAKAEPAADAGPTGRTGPSPTYQLSARVEPAQPLSEREPNGDAGTAGDLYLADQVKGWIGWAGDVDVWKLSLEGLGSQSAIDVDVGGVPGLVLTVEILDAAGRSLVARKGARDGGVAIRSLVPALGEGAPPFHLVKISADRSNPVEVYSLKVAPRLLDLDEEAEPNDAPDKASALRVGAAQSGSMRATYVAGDIDCFVLDASPGPMLIDVSVDVPAGVDFVVDLRNQSGQALASADAGGAGGRERLTGTIPAGSPAIVQIAAKPSKTDTGEARPYQLRWSVSPSDGAPMPPEEAPAQGGAP